MTVCAIRCAECGGMFYASEPGRIDYVQIQLRGRLRPVCRACYEDHRAEERKKR